MRALNDGTRRGRRPARAGAAAAGRERRRVRPAARHAGRSGADRPAEGGIAADPATVADWRRSLGLAASLPAQYLDWLGGLATGDWGLSIRTRRPVARELGERIGWSCAIGMGGMALAALLSLPLGRAAALRPGGAVDAASRIAIALQSVPGFVLATASCSGRRPYPARCDSTPAARSSAWSHRRCWSASMPSRRCVRVVRRAYLEKARAVLHARGQAKGLSRRDALSRHGGRAALLALLSALPPQATWAVGGTVVVEIVFGIPGVSQLVVDSVAARDYAVLQVFVMLVAVAMVLVHAAADLLRGRLDPRPAS